jgi:hypothetical protein
VSAIAAIVLSLSNANPEIQATSIWYVVEQGVIHAYLAANLGLGDVGRDAGISRIRQHLERVGKLQQNLGTRVTCTQVES